MERKVALVTGSGRRVGAEIARHLHTREMNIVLHCRESTEEAKALCAEFNHKIPDSASVVQADLLEMKNLQAFSKQVGQIWGRLDLLVNNASGFYPTPVADVTECQWDDLFGSNLKAPFFLSKLLAPVLSGNSGSIVNIVDIYAEKPLKDYPVYSMTKAGLAAMCRALAIELAPDVRVNGVAPGAILWPENENNDDYKNRMLSRIPLEKTGEPVDIAKTVAFLGLDADYITGQIIPVDGGRSISM